MVSDQGRTSYRDSGSKEVPSPTDGHSNQILRTDRTSNEQTAKYAESVERDRDKFLDEIHVRIRADFDRKKQAFEDQMANELEQLKKDLFNRQKSEIEKIDRLIGEEVKQHRSQLDKARLSNKDLLDQAETEVQNARQHLKEIIDKGKAAIEQQSLESLSQWRSDFDRQQEEFKKELEEKQSQFVCEQAENLELLRTEFHAEKEKLEAELKHFKDCPSLHELQATTGSVDDSASGKHLAAGGTVSLEPCLKVSDAKASQVFERVEEAQISDESLQKSKEESAQSVVLKPQIESQEVERLISCVLESIESQLMGCKLKLRHPILESKATQTLPQTQDADIAERQSSCKPEGLKLPAERWTYDELFNRRAGHKSLPDPCMQALAFIANYLTRQKRFIRDKR